MKRLTPALAQTVLCIGCLAEQQTPTTEMPVATQWTLDAAGPVQQNGIKAVVLLVCPVTHMKGTGFLVNDGLVVTNNHVVSGCSAQQMVGHSSLGATIHFRKLSSDQVVDLALLRPTEVLGGGLQLAAGVGPSVGTPVSTWGYPLSFNGPAPILSTGYIAGFLEDGPGEKKVKHLIINGAFNPGNSGGPLFKFGDDKVIGIVVAKLAPFSESVQKTIDVMAQNGTGVIYTATDSSGKTRNFSEGQVVASILQEFYNDSQVMIGEAISVFELRALLSSKEAELK
jgi:S1-C subfamily serine protease